ncbi:MULTISPECIES: hypothetical protein [Pseudomonadaceae]|uniref:hypothetical protein n=1 Tax=Pseudomonadaceae TaxID=135621 RepID=UPI0015E2BD9C|nr:MULTISPECIES: hypothetical protein [Pseudomonadaceae]MBA1280594.1 hypothetical protein [Stutzerimonas stutzeri]MBH8610677.1 hypothetical protein [Pseudomonas mohnii]
MSIATSAGTSSPRERRLFTGQQLGFYFSVNGLKYTVDDISESDFEAASQINNRAYQLLLQRLPACEFWRVQDENNPEIQYCPFEVCEESFDEDNHDGEVAFSFWLHSAWRLCDAQVVAFKKEVVSAYEAAAAELGGVCQFLRCEAVIFENVTTTQTVALG